MGQAREVVQKRFNSIHNGHSVGFAATEMMLPPHWDMLANRCSDASTKLPTSGRNRDSNAPVTVHRPLILRPTLLAERHEDGAAPPRQQPESEDHARAARIAVGRGHAVAHDEHRRASAPVRRAFK